MINFPKLLRLLTEHEAAFIIIGGVAAVIHGSSRLTQDLDLEAIAELEIIWEEQQEG
jgi:hypothetical protein